MNAPGERLSVARVELVVRGMPIEDVTAQLGREPTRVVRKSRTNASQGEELWILERESDLTTRVADVLASLVRSLVFRRADLHRVRKKAKHVALLVRLPLDERTGGLEIASDTLSTLADLGLPLTLSLHCPTSGVSGAIVEDS